MRTRTLGVAAAALTVARPVAACGGDEPATDPTDLTAETRLSSNRFDDKTFGVPQVTDWLALLYPAVSSVRSTRWRPRR